MRVASLACPRATPAWFSELMPFAIVGVFFLQAAGGGKVSPQIPVPREQ